MTSYTIRTHRGEHITDKQAFLTLAAELRAQAREWFYGNGPMFFMNWMTEEDKQSIIEWQHLMLITKAQELDRGEIHSFKDWQDINAIITGECVALLS